MCTKWNELDPKAQFGVRCRSEFAIATLWAWFFFTQFRMCVSVNGIHMNIVWRKARALYNTINEKEKHLGYIRTYCSLEPNCVACNFQWKQMPNGSVCSTVKNSFLPAVFFLLVSFLPDYCNIIKMTFFIYFARITTFRALIAAQIAATTKKIQDYTLIRCDIIIKYIL